MQRPVLLAGGDPLLVETIGCVLVADGHDVVTSPPATAAELIGRYGPGLILVDAREDAASGVPWEMVRAARAWETDRPVTIVALIGAGESEPAWCDAAVCVSFELNRLFALVDRYQQATHGSVRALAPLGN